MKHRIIVYGGILLCLLGIVYVMTRTSDVTVVQYAQNPPPPSAQPATSTNPPAPNDPTSTPAAASATVTTPFPAPVPLVEDAAAIASSAPIFPPFDAKTYDEKMLAIANLPIVKVKHVATSTLPDGTATSTVTYTTSTAKSAWPVKGLPYPNAGAALPFVRIVAYYGNFLSTGMGVLGQYPPKEMLARLMSTTAEWQAADPSTPAVPALDYIAVTAQGSPGPDGMYRARMPATEIQKAINLAASVNGLVFLDVQVGLSSVEKEVPLLEPYLKLPQVHLSLDPEFDMHGAGRPGTVIGTMDASEINWAAQYLARIVRENNLPPKMLVIHRFTENMVTNYKKIAPLPEVQIVMDMDGFGSPAKKIGTYTQVVAPEPVQFTGFKLFFKNDAYLYGNHLMTPEEVLRLSPRPSYIQYQ